MHETQARRGVRRGAAVLLAMVLALSLGWQRTWADEGRQLIPVGKAVGIKLFADGVLVVSVSPVQGTEETRSPAKECGLKEGDILAMVMALGLISTAFAAPTIDLGRISGRAGGGAGAQRHRAGFAAAGGRGLCVELAGGSDGVRYGGLCPSRSGNHAGGGGWCAAGSRAGAGETASKKEACSAGTATSRDDIECSMVKITKISL